MVICKFFLQGYCRFGDHCKFEHPINDSYNINKTQHTSILWQSQLGSSQQYRSQNNSFFQKQNSAYNVQEKNSANSVGGVDLETLIKSVVNDMTSVEKSRQWLLSCYGPFKEKPVFPGFEDYCFEEIRCGFYEAIKTGTLEQYKQHINGLLQQAILRIKALQKPSPEIVEILKNIYNTPLANTTSNVGTLFTNTTAAVNQNAFPVQNTSIFAKTNQNLFVKQSVSTPTQQFSNTSGSIFGGPQNVSNIQQSTNQNILAQANANLNIQNNGPIFGKHQNNVMAPTKPNMFPTQTIFAQSPSQPSTFGNQNFSPLQETDPAKISTPTFGNQNSPHFSTQLPSSSTQSIFGTNQNPVNNYPQQTHIFGSSSFVTNNPQSLQSSILEHPQPSVNFNNSPLFQPKSAETGQTTNIFGAHLNRPPVDQTLYSKLEDLSEDEIKWFQSDEHDPMKIPEKPPTFEMCFKT